MKCSLYIVVILAIMADLAFAETYADSKAEFKIPIGQERQNDMANTIKATVGKEFVITLDANEATGYKWQLTNPTDDSLINLVRSEYVPYKTGLVGSGGKSIWTFKAVQAGRAQISLKYIRPWEENAPPAKEAIYVVNIQESVKALEATEVSIIDSSPSPAPETGLGEEIEDEEIVDRDI